MYCGKCGAQNPDDYRFCQSCGASLGLSSVSLSGPATSAPRSKPMPGALAGAVALFLFVGCLFLFLALSVLCAQSTGGRAWSVYGSLGSMMATFAPCFLIYFVAGGVLCIVGAVGLLSRRKWAIKFCKTVSLVIGIIGIPVMLIFTGIAHSLLDKPEVMDVLT